MRNLIAFFKRFQVFLAFVAFQAIALSLYVTYMSFPKSQYLTSASLVTGEILSVKNQATELLNLSHTNSVLQRKLIAYRKQKKQSFIQIDRNLFKINDTLFQQQYEYIPATVINSTFDKRNNYFTLDVGKLQGVKRDMGVFSEKGIVGIVHYSGDHYSIVKSVLTENINIDVMVENSGAFGLLKWETHHARRGNISGISNDMRLKKWSKVVTRGGSGYFPKGIPVGMVSSVKSIEGKPLWNVEIIFAEDFRKIQKVYVIKNLLRTEQEEVESHIPIDKEEE
ncbi:MAG: rod shape-determining protein MreC [Flavobacteriia bacterium]|jgi:rod shape-determining protein MreC